MDAFKILEPVELHSPLLERTLPSLGDGFKVPVLEEKPQNPIVQNLVKNTNNGSRRTHRYFLAHRPHQALPRELAILSERIVSMRELDALEGEDEENIWEKAAQAPSEYLNPIASWDTLRSTYRHPDTPSPFLTEQDPHIVNAIRHHVNPRMFNPNCEPVYVSADDLLEDLRSTSVACSSSLHIWDPTLERFVPTGTTSELEKVVIIVGMDEVISQSFISRFVTIGTLLRRLETLAESLRQLVATNDSTSYAFGHALTSVTVALRDRISSTMLTAAKLSSARLSALWTSLSEPEETFISLASMCHRDISSTPQTYKDLPSSSQALLSHIYTQLHQSLERSSSSLLTALLAYILTITSRPFFRDVCQSVGFKGVEQSRGDMKRRAMKQREEVRAGIFVDGDVGEAEGGDDEFEESEDTESGGGSKTKESFPVFMDKNVVDAIIGARRSLKILFMYELDHGSATPLPDLSLVEWVWTEDELSSLLLSNGMRRHTDSNIPPTTPIHRSTESTDTHKYKPELASFAKFDLPPGSLASPSTHTIISFLHDFPSSFPSLTPSLPILTHAILTPLLTHSRHLSSAALRIFMTPNTRLHFRAHLLLLRSYLLCMAQGFRARMENALFEDGEGDENDEYGEGQSGRVSRKGTTVVLRKKLSSPNLLAEGPWAVGIAQSLTDRGSWPPGGSDLGILLRHVIMDSVEDVRQSVFVKPRIPVPVTMPPSHSVSASVGVSSKLGHGASASVGSTISADGAGGGDDGELDCDDFWEDVEERLGFATEGLRDTGKEKWLDPTSIESLDFLYMLYKPPRPLDSLITQEILSKYRRVFTFLLRLMRVENALKAVFRLTRPTSSPLFPRSSPTHKSLLTLRFKMQIFLSSLSSYIYTTAIGGNIDAFLSRLLAAERSASTGNTLPTVFTDVFSLMKYHSTVMDDVMTACMLRTAQGKLRDLVKGCLECVLAFAILVGEIRRSRVSAEDAERRMKRVGEKFEERVRVLVRALRASVDVRGSPLPANTSKFDSSEGAKGQQIATGGIEALGDLALRLSMSEWWKSPEAH